MTARLVDRVATPAASRAAHAHAGVGGPSVHCLRSTRASSRKAAKSAAIVPGAGARQAHRWGEPGTDEIPDEYLAQVHWYLALLPGIEAADVPVLIGGQDFRIYRVLPDAALEAELLEVAERFWVDHVQARVPPEVDGSESARAWLARRFPRESDSLVVPACPEADKWARMLLEARRLVEQGEESKALAENKLKELIGEAAGMKGQGFRISWKATAGRPLVDWDAIAKEAGIPSELIAKHTTRKPSRAFRATFED